ncbi:MAG: CorA family divalent cation transporter [Asticcacaulis sp.]
MLYDAVGHDSDVDAENIDLAALGENQLLWIAGARTDIEGAKALPAEIIDAVRRAAGATGLEISDAFYAFVVPASVQRAASDLPLITFVVGASWLVTLANARPAFMDRFLETDIGETLKGKMTPSALAAALILEHLTDYRSEVAAVDKAIDALDDTIMRAREKRAPLKTLAVLRRRVANLRSTLGELGGLIHALTRPDFLAHIDDADAVHFQHLSRTHERMEDMVVRARETVIGSFDLYATRVAQDTNQLVKALTIATVVTGIIGAIAGIFGMNFDIPFDHSGFTGFMFVVAVMVVSSAGVLTVAIWRRWM